MNYILYEKILDILKNRIEESLSKMGVCNELLFTEELVRAGGFLEGNFAHLDCIVKTGATKLVIIPTEGDFVIKVPYNGYFRQLSSEIDPDKDFYDFTGARGGWDYCKVEKEIFNEAKQRNYDVFFPQTQYVDTIQVLGKDLPFYIQEKCCTLRNADSIDEDKSSSSFVGNNYFTKRHKKLMEEVGNDDYDLSIVYELAPYPEWVGELVEKYGDEEFDCFLEFLEENEIGDIHEDNIGYSSIDGRPVLIDFSGYDM